MRAARCSFYGPLGPHDRRSPWHAGPARRVREVEVSHAVPTSCSPRDVPQGVVARSFETCRVPFLLPFLAAILSRVVRAPSNAAWCACANQVRTKGIWVRNASEALRPVGSAQLRDASRYIALLLWCGLSPRSVHERSCAVHVPVRMYAHVHVHLFTGTNAHAQLRSYVHGYACTRRDA